TRRLPLPVTRATFLPGILITPRNGCGFRASASFRCALSRSGYSLLASIDASSSARFFRNRIVRRSSKVGYRDHRNGPGAREMKAVFPKEEMPPPRYLFPDTESLPAVPPLIALLRQLGSFIESLSDVQYGQKPVGPVPSSIGGHVRHSLDHLTVLLNAAGDED